MQRTLIWAELDSNASDPQHTTLLIHPGKNLVEGHRYVVALRNLKNASGQTLAAPDWFARFRDDRPLLKSQQSEREHYGQIFKSLKDAGIDRKTLYMAWDFTVASRQSLTSPMLSIRNDAFGQRGDTNLSDLQVQGTASPFTVTNVQNFTPDQNPRLLREVLGTFTVPCYLTTSSCAIGGGFNYSSTSPDATPTQQSGNVGTAQFDCIVPRAAEGAPARASLYGHGLLGSRTEVHAGNVQDMAAEHNFVFCATDWWGLAQADTPFDVSALQNLNRFPAVTDRLQQGVLNTLLLGRLMANPNGFASDAAFQAERKPAVRHLQPVLRRQQPGRDHGRHHDRRRARLHARRARRHRHGLRRGPPAAQHRLHAVRRVPVREQPGGGYTDSSIHPLILDLMQQLGIAARPTATRHT